MSDAKLDAAIIAARQVADAAAARDGVATKLRIRETLARRRSRRGPILAAIAATMFGSTAFAYYASTASKAVAVEAPPAPVPAMLEVATEQPAPPRVRIVTPAPPAPPAVVAVEPPVAEVKPERDPEIAAYGVAHDAHFKSSPEEALRLWDAYLATYPSGKLAVDARYSRALILIKLERHGDAVRALRPFAEAPAGSYRQAEAAKLLEALEP